LRNVPSLETIHRDYSPRDVRFHYIYKALAHPENNGYVTPFTLEERLMHIREAERTLGSAIPWICDTMANDLKHALGDAPNSEFIIDPDGKVVRRRSWSNPVALRRDLEELVGAVEHPTRVEDLDLVGAPPPKVAASGVVPRVRPPDRMSPVTVIPRESSSPFYVKLRAEADENLLRQGKGTLYLGFHLDPLYHVHWNNLAAPLTFSIKTPSGVEATPPRGEGPKVDAPADVDPREFLIEVSGASRDSLTVHVDYFACNDDEGWCRPASQQYTVSLQYDPDGGTVRGRDRGPMDNRARGGPLAQRPGPRPESGPTGRPPETRLDDVERVMGLVVRADAAHRTIQVRGRGGLEREFHLTDDAVLIVDGRRAEPGDLAPGQRVVLGFRRSEDGKALAMRVTARTGGTY